MSHLEIFIASFALALIFHGVRAGWKIGRKFIKYVNKP